MIKIAVVIPTYNQKKDVKEAVESLLSQTVQVRKIIVVDNASSDNTSEYLSRYFKDSKTVQVVKNSKNLGVTGGRNKGIEYVEDAEYIIFFDHDMVADKKMVEELLTVANSEKRIGIVTPKIYYWENKNVIWSAGTDVNLLTGQTLFRGGEDIGQYDTVEEVAVAPAVLLVKRKALDFVKKFDPIFFTTYEDTDFCFRAKLKGYLTYYVPKAIAYHKIPYNDSKATVRLLSRAYWVARNRIIFMRRYSHHFGLFLLIQPLFFAYYITLATKYKNISAIREYIRGTINGIQTGTGK